MTASVDGTVRLWDIAQVMHRNTGLFHVTQKRNHNRRVPVNKAIYSQQGDHLVLAGKQHMFTSDTCQGS